MNRYINFLLKRRFPNRIGQFGGGDKEKKYIFLQS